MALAYLLALQGIPTGRRKPGSPVPFGPPPTSTGLARPPLPPPAYDPMAGLATSTGSAGSVSSSPSRPIGLAPREPISKGPRPGLGGGADARAERDARLGLERGRLAAAQATRARTIQRAQSLRARIKTEIARMAAGGTTGRGQAADTRHAFALKDRLAEAEAILRQAKGLPPIPAPGLTPRERASAAEGAAEPSWLDELGAWMGSGPHDATRAAFGAALAASAGGGSTYSPVQSGVDPTTGRFARSTKNVGRDVRAVTQGVLAAPHAAMRAAASGLSQGLGNGPVDPSVYRHDVPSRVADHVGEYAPYAIPGVGQGLAAVQGLDAAVGAANDGLGKAASDLYHGMAPWEARTPEEAALRFLGLLGGAAHVAGMSPAIRGRVGIAAEAIRRGRPVDRAVVTAILRDAHAEAAGTLRALKASGEWGWIAKAKTAELAAKAAQRRLGLSPEQAQAAIKIVEASGERVWWRGKTDGARPGRALEEEAGRVGATLGQENTDARMRAMEAKPLESPGLPSKGRKSIKAPRAMKWVFEKLDDRTAGLTDLDNGNVSINNIFEDYNHDRTLDNPDMVRKFVRALRHEWFHSSQTPARGVPTSELRGWHAYARNLRKSLYTDNQFGRYVEEALAEAYATRSLPQGVRYISSKDNMHAYRLTSGGIAKDAGKLGLGIIAGLGAINTEAEDASRKATAFWDAYEDYRRSRSMGQPSSRRKPG